MSATNILTQPPEVSQDSNTIIILSNGDFVIVPEGADPSSLRKLHENQIYRAANHHPRRKRANRPVSNKKRNYAESILWMRNAELTVIS